MGVTGLWRLIEPSGKPVPLETLENKVLGVDVSIWLHQAIKGFQDAQGAPLPNAHLLGIYHRVCKLLYFRVKPVFVFDGGVPVLKKETINKRHNLKSKKLSEADRIQKQLLSTLLKHSAVNKVLAEKVKANLAINTNFSAGASKNDTEDMYKLPPTEFDSTQSSEEEQEESTSESVNSSPTKQWDVHTIDEKSPHFKSLPVDVRHEILTELKETRKQSSWGRLHELPKQSGEFSSFQMKRLLKRYSVQVSLEEAEKEMGGRTLSLAELEALLNDQGIDTSNDSVGSRIASDENTRYLLIKDVKKAMDEAKKQKEVPDVLSVIGEETENKKDVKMNNSKLKEKVENSTETNDKNSIENQETTGSPNSEYQKDLEKAIQLSLQDVPSTSKERHSDTGTSSSKHQFSFLQDFDDADFHSSGESEEELQQQKDEERLASVKSYMTEYSGLTPNEIAKIMSSNNANVNKNKKVIKSNETSSTSTKIVNKYSNKTASDSEVLIEEDKQVSSSTTTISKVVKETSNDLLNSNAVSSSTSREVAVNQTETVEIITDASSDDEFLDVSEKPSNSVQLGGFEILIKPEDELKDDIFSDIFSDQKPINTVDSTSMQIKKQSTSNIEGKSLEVTTKDNRNEFDVSKNKETVINEQVTSSETAVDITKEERTRSVIAELAKAVDSKENAIVQTVQRNEILTTNQLQTLEENLRQESANLLAGRLSKERLANNLTDQIYQEAQELLELFGVPYIVAPMEAEAQCAFLDDINLTDGTITDDSDIWLFGGKTVYKNFFNQQKHVMEYRLESIQHHFKLTREQMILLALLVGSDYTVGLQGVGPVTALEILAAFPSSKLADIKLTHQQLISGLKEFRQWLAGDRAVGSSKTTLRNKLKNVTLIDSFPSAQVVKAYLEPTVDSSNEPFSWAKPDIAGLIEFARKKFGWHRVKSEEILKPVLKRLNESRIQRSIKDYFRTKHKIDGDEAENKMSKRVKKAVDRIGGKEDEQSDNEKCSKLKTGVKRKSKRVVKSTKEDNANLVVGTNKDDTAELPPGLSSDEDIQILTKICKESKKKVEQIEKEVKSEITKQEAKKPRTIAHLHQKEVIPQKERDKIELQRSKMKAIEVFRKSKQGPGYLKKRKVVPRKPKDDAGLSDSSSTD